MFPLNRNRWLLAACALLLAAIPAARVLALITGGTGNEPLHDPGWPAGAAAIFNHPARVAWWEGPPLGGGQWTAECRGDVKAFNAVLANFAKLEVKTKRLIVHDGVGSSIWLRPDADEKKKVDGSVDWSFMVWQAESWNRLRTMPADFNPIPQSDMANGPPVQIDVFTGGQIHWADVIVPAGLKVDDQRMEAHGFTPADGTVLEGNVIDLETKKPLAATITLQRIEAQKSGGYLYPKVAETIADGQGHWIVKNASEGWYQLVATFPGYAPRNVGYGTVEKSARWHSYDSGLARSAVVSGRVVDEAGKSLVDVNVQFSQVTAADGSRYQIPEGSKIMTDAEGRFRNDQLPVGKTSIWVNKDGYCIPGLGTEITTPKDGVTLTMLKSSNVHVTVVYEGPARPEGFMVSLIPEGGEAVGKWSGSANLDATNQYEFKNVPPGKYVLDGQPNPGTVGQKTKSILLDLKGGETVQETLNWKQPVKPVAQPVKPPKPPAENGQF